MKALSLFLLATCASALLHADIVERNIGLDESNLGNWTFSPVTPAFRDNIDTNTNWLATNGGHFLKAPYGVDDGTTNAEGFSGVYKGAVGDTVYMDYTFTAAQAIVQQDWIVKATVWRVDNARSARLQFAVNVNANGFTPIMNSEWFGRTADGADYDLAGFTASPYGIDGPTAFYSADLTALNIQSGDSVVYRFTMAANDALAGTSSRNVGLGVQLVPEPSSLLLLLAGACGLALRRRP